MVHDDFVNYCLVVVQSDTRIASGPHLDGLSINIPEKDENSILFSRATGDDEPLRLEIHTLL